MGSRVRRLVACLGVVAAALGSPVAADARPGRAPSAKPSVTTLSATYSPLTGGAVLTVRGRHFDRLRAVVVDGRAARRTGAATSSSVRIVLPAHRAAVVHVQVRTAAGVSSRVATSRLTYVAPPVVTALTAPVVPAGRSSRVTVWGRNFVQVSGVRFGSVQVRAVTVRSTGRLDVTVPAAVAGSARVLVRTPFGTSPAGAASTITYLAGPVIDTTSLPPATVGEPYRAALLARGDRSGTWTVRSGTLPPGLQLRAGEIVGIPTRAAIAALQLRYADRIGQFDDQVLDLLVNDSRWALGSLPTPPGGRSGSAYLTHVDCPSDSMCAAVGDYDVDGVHRGLLATWVDGTWTTQAMQVGDDPAYEFEFEQIRAISCGAPGRCAAIGRTTALEPVVAVLVDGVWTSTLAPVLAGSDHSVLRSVSCHGVDICVAVGSRGVKGLIETYQDGAWTASALPDAVDASAVLGDVDCAAEGACTAVGHYQAPTGEAGGLVLELSDGRWQQQAVPTPAGAPASRTSGELLAVSCPTAATCRAVGADAGRALVAVRTPSGWTSSRTQDDVSHWYAIDCGTPEHCLLAGAGTDSRPGLAVLDGGGVRGVVLPSPITGVRSVSCSSAQLCAFVGTARRSGAPGVGVVGTVDVGGAAPQHVALPADATTDPAVYTRSRTSDVSCTPDRCVAVGSYDNGRGAAPLVADYTP